MQISPDGQWLAAFGHTPIGVAVAEPQHAEQPIQQVSHRLDRSPTPANTLPNSSPYPVLLWNLQQMELGNIPTAMPISSASMQPTQVVRFSPNSDQLAIGRKAAVVGVYDLTARGVNGDPITLQGHQLGITQIAFAPCGRWIASGSQDNTVRLWDLSPYQIGAELATLYGHIGWISALSIDPTGEYIVSGSYDRTIRIWNVKRDRLDATVHRGPTVLLETNLGIPEALLITQDGDKLIALGDVGSLGIFHLPSLLEGDSEALDRSVTFRNRRLSISQCLLLGDEQQFLIFSYEHLQNPANSGIRLWSLDPFSLAQYTAPPP
jgi:WD40 repeat protein